ncbi:Probable serine/threonine-protein kinase pats1 (Protein associated with the transduction of signal 1) [Durusdinium trenchii]|uniref:Probable serine/threonine-protein kinase pats1 (Protein associated with the transduction of signal 1) n=2 Tax=Durusdinium trenchii TaxID=1381693 RepID=A0ABP0QP99_9DINO
MASGGVWNTQQAFLAQLRDGSLEAWGHPDYGAPIPADIIASGQKHGLKRAWSTWQGGFLVELQNGEFHAWGNKEKGADIDAVKATLEREGVVQIWSTSGAFLAELTSGKVLTWGDAGWGGEVTTSVREALEAEGIHRAWSTHGAFIVELKSGRVVAWGRSEFGSQIPSDAQAAMRTKGLRDIWTTRFGAVVAQLNTGEVISWGDTNRGADVGGVKDRLEAAGVRHMWRSTFAFLAQLKTGEILCWGDKNRGGALPAATKEALDAHGIARAWSTTSAFLAELTNGSVVAWGVGSGAEIPDDLHSSLEREGIREAFGTAGAFLVVLKSGRCVAWGDPRYGADLSSVKDKLETVGLALSAPATPAPEAPHAGPGTLPSGSPRTAAAFLRVFDMSPESVKLTEEISNYSSWVSRATVKLEHGEVPAVVKAMQLPQDEKEKKKEHLLWMKKELEHPNLVKILGLYWCTNTVMCVAVEPAPRCLRRLLQQEPSLAQREHLPLALGIASAMMYLHDLAEPILHQDLKPENVLIFDSDSKLIPKVTDVGFNQNGGGKGALAYKAPEMFEEKFQMASEVYAFAVICFEILTGQQAWKGRSDLGIMRAVCDGQRPAMDDPKTDLGPIIQDSWAADPEARPRFAAICERLKPQRFPKKLSTAAPSYWSGTGEALDQGWAAVPVSEKTFEALKKLFVVTQPEQLGEGRDCKDYRRKYSNLQLLGRCRICDR